MAKPKRGKSVKIIKNWRGTCPRCGRTGAKLLWEAAEGDKKMKVCKVCDAQIRNKAS
jgi:uncharacterized protein (DUF983 family)